MDTKRFVLAIGLTLLILWLYQSWLEYQYPAYYKESKQTEQSGKPGKPQGKAQGGAHGQAPAPNKQPEKAQGSKPSGNVPEVQSSGAKKPSGPAPSGKQAPAHGVTVN
ncbi:MAG TPA: hypothetical protein VKA48_00585, partial [Gammaproteobacteria bacterium]|nr:hypothetical protein [Gammaproteobacteria bacterium]